MNRPGVLVLVSCVTNGLASSCLVHHQWLYIFLLRNYPFDLKYDIAAILWQQFTPHDALVSSCIEYPGLHKGFYSSNYFIRAKRDQ